MGRFAQAYGPGHPEATYIPHTIPEQRFDTGVVEINYAVAGREDQPALLLIPGQSESWWGCEPAMPLLAQRFQAFAVDLRGQGRFHANARSLHARQHGQQPCPFHRRRHPTPHHRQWAIVGRRAIRVALGLYKTRPDPRRALRRSTALPLRGRHLVRPISPPGRRSDVRAMEQVPVVPTMGHAMHMRDPRLFADTLFDWAKTLP